MFKVIGKIATTGLGMGALLGVGTLFGIYMTAIAVTDDSEAGKQVMADLKEFRTKYDKKQAKKKEISKTAKDKKFDEWIENLEKKLHDIDVQGSPIKDNTEGYQEA